MIVLSKISQKIDKNVFSTQDTKPNTPEIICYQLTASLFGYLLVAATEKGVCKISLGDDEESLKANLIEVYPQATLQSEAEDLTQWIKAILDHLQGKTLRIDLTLDTKGTNFQSVVWKALSDIPYGETRSYQEIARIIGNESAVRAVARACASNPVAIAIPCHRVIRQDGGLGGYRWGLERKQILLQKEREQVINFCGE